MNRALVVVLLFLTGGCSSAKVAGGATVPIGNEPAGALLGTWFPSACRDARGDPVTGFKGAVVTLVRGTDGRVVLVEMRPAYDSLVVTNSFIRGPDLVFQLALKSSSSPPYLREYRLPAGNAVGRFVIVARDWDSRETARGFEAWYKRPVIDCALLPQSRSDAASL